MKNFEANACMDAFCALCEQLAHDNLISLDECQYWVFELGYKSNNAGLTEFSTLCDLADLSTLISTIDCQYWLFERGYLAARKAQTSLSESYFEDLTMFGKTSTISILPCVTNQ
jgi:hypothetical protein